MFPEVVWICLLMRFRSQRPDVASAAGSVFVGLLQLSQLDTVFRDRCSGSILCSQRLVTGVLVLHSTFHRMHTRT